MKKYLARGAALLAVISLLLFGQISVARAANDQRVEDQIRQANAQEVAAFLQNDPKTLELLWSDDLIVTNPLNQLVTKQQVLGMVRSGFLAFTSLERQVEYIKIYGDTAIVAGSETAVWSGKIPLAGSTSHLRFTSVWMKQSGAWRQVARHANIIPPKPDGAPGKTS